MMNRKLTDICINMYLFVELSWHKCNKICICDKYNLQGDNSIRIPEVEILEIILK